MHICKPRPMLKIHTFNPPLPPPKKKKKKRFRAGFHFKFFSFAYMSRLAFSLTLLFLSAYLCALASMCTGYRTPQVILLDLDHNPIANARTLPDLGHDLWAWFLTKINYSHDYVNIYSIPDVIAA